MVEFIKENSVEIFMSRIAVEEAGNSGGDGGATFSCPEEAMTGRMGILVVCRFERLLVEEQVSASKQQGHLATASIKYLYSTIYNEGEVPDVTYWTRLSRSEGLLDTEAGDCGATFCSTLNAPRWALARCSADSCASKKLFF